MTTLTYMDINEDCPRTAFQGIPFKDGVPVELDDSNPAHRDIIDTLDGNKWFKIERAKAEETKRKAEIEAAAENPDRYRAAGAQAFKDGKPLSIPPRWRKTSAGEAWAAGYKLEKARMDAARDARENA